MLLYLSGHTRPDIAFAVSQCARYTFKPTKRHVATLKRIGRYLKGTADKGLILHPSRSLQVDCYPDADFAGLYGHEDPHVFAVALGMSSVWQDVQYYGPRNSKLASH